MLVDPRGQGWYCYCTLVFICVSVLFCHPLQAELRIASNVVTEADTAILNALTANGTSGLRGEIFSRMVQAADVFAFVNIDHASINFDLREATVGAIGQIKPDGPVFFEFGDPGTFACPPGWHMHERNALFPIFDKDDGVPTSTAVSSFEIGTARGECAGALKLALLLGELRAMGAQWMNNDWPDSLSTFN